jgi:hypothetical protein
MSASASIAGRWFDGKHGMAQAVEVSVQGAQLHFGDRYVPLAQVQWPERMRHGQRLILLRGAGVISFSDAAAFDAYAPAASSAGSSAGAWR